MKSQHYIKHKIYLRIYLFLLSWCPTASCYTLVSYTRVGGKCFTTGDREACHFLYRCRRELPEFLFGDHRNMSMASTRKEKTAKMVSEKSGQCKFNSYLHVNCGCAQKSECTCVFWALGALNCIVPGYSSHRIYNTYIVHVFIYVCVLTIDLHKHINICLQKEMSTIDISYYWKCTYYTTKSFLKFNKECTLILNLHFNLTHMRWFFVHAVKIQHKSV